jgi:aconitate hydratase
VYEITHSVSSRQVNILLHGGLINEFKQKLSCREDLSNNPSISPKQESFADKQDVLG